MSKSDISSRWMAKNVEFSFPQDDETRLHRLEAHWNEATTGFKNQREWFHDKIVPMYSESTRHYHTLVHLEEMLGYLELMAVSSNYDDNEIDKQVLVLTIFFHDVIYDAKSSTNEEDSAKLFEDFWNETQQDNEDVKDVKSRVIRYILATKQHTATNDDACAQALLDIDMAVLGKQKDAYWKYASLIRKEYNFVPRDVYCEKRAQVLKGFLEQPIFGTHIMKNVLEEQARANLKSEIESLERGAIPGEAPLDL